MIEGSAAIVDISRLQKIRTDLLMKEYDPSFTFIIPGDYIVQPLSVNLNLGLIMHSLCIYYAFTMHLLCIHFAFIMHFLCTYTEAVDSM